MNTWPDCHVPYLSRFSLKYANTADAYSAEDSPPASKMTRCSPVQALFTCVPQSICSVACYLYCRLCGAGPSRGADRNLCHREATSVKQYA